MKALVLGVVAIALISTLGCAEQAGPSAAGQAFLLAAAPSEAAMGVVTLKSALTADPPLSGDVLVEGRIGGGQNETWDATRAAFLIRDLGLKIQSHDHGGDHDNCKFCQAEKAKELESMALVEIVDDTGAAVATDARTLLGVKEEQVIVAQGQGSVDDVGNFVFSATKIYVRPDVTTE